MMMNKKHFKNRLNIRLFLILCMVIPALAFTKKQDKETSFQLFLNAFQRFENRDTVLILADIKTPQEFGCGTAAHEFFSQLHGFSGKDCNQCKPVTDQKSIDQLSQKMNLFIIWYGLHGNFFTIDHSGKQESLPFVNNADTKKLLTEPIRLTIRHEKISRKKEIYHATFINLLKEERTEKSHHLSRRNKQWTLDSITTVVSPFKNNDAYIYYLKD